MTRDAEKVAIGSGMEASCAVVAWQLDKAFLAVNGSVPPQPSGAGRNSLNGDRGRMPDGHADQGRLIRFGRCHRDAFRQGPGENKESLHAAVSDVWLEHWTENTTRPDAQGVSFWEVIHLGLIREVGVTRPQFPDRMPRIARLPPLRREDTASPIVASKPLTLRCLITE